MTTHPTKSTFKVIRERLGELEGKVEPISQQDFACRLGAGITSVNRWEAGKPPRFTVPQVKQLNKILTQIGWNVEDLPDDMMSEAE